MITYFPKFCATRATAVYIALLLLVPLVFGNPMTWYWWVFGIVEVICFFILGSALTKSWSVASDRSFVINVFELAFVLRLAYVIFSYYFYIAENNSFFEFGAADSYTYHMFAEHGADMIKNGEYNFKQQFDAMGFFSRGVDISDMGYPIGLSFWYLLTNKSIVLARVLKCFISSYTIVLVYRLAQRNFGGPVAKITAIFCVLMPNLIYYCGTHLKETEMLFLTVLFIERADSVLRGKINVWALIPVFLIAGLTYFFRGVLAIILILAFFTALLLSSEKVLSKTKKVFIIGMSVVMLVVSLGNNLVEQLDLSDITQVQAQQDANMQWRSERSGGNQFSNMASSAVFAPLIFTIPFPTMVDIPYQETQQLLNGGNYVKNITSFFTVLALILLLFSGEWREKVLPIAFMLGYLLVLVFSNFAQSERFHIPILPFSLMFAAYGITQMKNKHKRWFVYWLVFIFVANMGWTWFKLRGRGM